jgi:hypothetical protein
MTHEWAAQPTYVKASNTNASDYFGWTVALSGDGSTLAVGASAEDSNATGLDDNQADNSAVVAGAVYVYVRDAMTHEWAAQPTYVKASNTNASDYFGYHVALSGDGSTLAIGAPYEASTATGLDGDQANNSASYAGAVYVYVRDPMTHEWAAQPTYVKASNTDASDDFGYRVALSGDGSTLAVGAIYEDSNATGLAGDQLDNSAPNTGAVYLY